MQFEDLVKNKIFSVSEFNEFLNSVLRPLNVTVEGEIADLRISQNKFVWFTLKDEKQALSCFSLVYRIRQPIEEGMKVRISGYPKIYEKSGKFSFIVEKLEVSGEGSLKRAYEILKNKLDAEGLFAPQRKRTIPKFPRTLGLITSRGAAAYTDFLTHVEQRWGGLLIQFFPVAVQGENAISEIVSAFDYFNHSEKSPDTIILTRGGGSLEDLKEFNSEEIARAVFSSKSPVIVAVGHERDLSLAELAADARASTPTHAAQLAVPDRQQLHQDISSTMERGFFALQSSQQTLRHNLLRTTQTLSYQIESSLGDGRRVLSDYIDLVGLLRQRLELAKNRRKTQVEVLKSLSPQGTLRRGYSIVRKSGKIIKTSEDVEISDSLEIHPYQGTITAKVTKKTYD